MKYICVLVQLSNWRVTFRRVSTTGFPMEDIDICVFVFNLCKKKRCIFFYLYLSTAKRAWVSPASSSSASAIDNLHPVHSIPAPCWALLQKNRNTFRNTENAIQIHSEIQKYNPNTFRNTSKKRLFLVGFYFNSLCIFALRIHIWGRRVQNSPRCPIRGGKDESTQQGNNWRETASRRENHPRVLLFFF